MNPGNLVPPANSVRRFARELIGRGDNTLGNWLQVQAARLTQLENGAVEISFLGDDTWGFESRDPEFVVDRDPHQANGSPREGRNPAILAPNHDPAIIAVKGTQGSFALVDALCAPDTVITLPVAYKAGRGRLRRAIEAFHVGPSLVVNALVFAEIEDGGDTTRVVFRPPDRYPTTFLRVERRARSKFAVRGESVHLTDSGELAVTGRANLRAHGNI